MFLSSAPAPSPRQSARRRRLARSCTVGLANTSSQSQDPSYPDAEYEWSKRALTRGQELGLLFIFHLLDVLLGGRGTGRSRLGPLLRTLRVLDSGRVLIGVHPAGVDRPLLDRLLCRPVDVVLDVIVAEEDCDRDPKRRRSAPRPGVEGERRRRSRSS